MSTEDRQKQIDIIARSFSMQSHAGDPRSFSEGIELGFKAGAAWADRNPACLTWYTSNLPLMPPDRTDGNPLLDRYGARVVSRLIGTTNYLTLIADDRRLKGGKR